jgi:hypothetical protein
MGAQHNEVDQVQRRISSWAMIAAIVLAVIFIIAGEKAIGKGLLLGTLFSIINFFLMGKSISLTLGQSRSRASFVGLLSILSRYVVLAIPMVVAIKSVSFNFVAVVIGIFAIQIVTLVDFIIIRPIWEGK